jgi:hypothetical protein
MAVYGLSRIEINVVETPERDVYLTRLTIKVKRSGGAEFEATHRL